MPVNQLFRIVIIAMIIPFLGACNPPPDEPYQEGTHYQIVSGTKVSSNNQVVLYISLTCPHCYSFSKLFDEYVANAPDDVQIERIPVLFNQPTWLGFVRLYATMRLLNVHDELLLSAFEAIQQQRVPLQARTAAINWLSATGLDRKTVEKVYDSVQANQWMDMYSRSEKMYQITAIPTLIVDGIYRVKTDALEAETDEERVFQLTQIIEFLHAKKVKV
jgi:thiol:disulfide interchange protein DsbA